ncbi:MAG TPA: family 10 glycosylhydrolase [Flavisolibacter sp.]|nr:family 10 glycosylhydrolase [Flavisolibacter sp.]
MNLIRIILICFTILVTACSKSGSGGNSPAPPVPTPTPTPLNPNAVRGMWITTTASTALNSLQNIKATVANCKAANINNLYVVVYNNAGTTYPSQVMNQLIGRLIKPEFTGRDPLAEIIQEAHAQGLKVHAWFEYGFAASFSANGGPIVQAKPNWAGKDVNGNLVTKNGFDWLNAFDPEVQNFLISLFKEVVTNYNVDGVQGDDRLPAMPTSGGYDAYTVNLYQSENNGMNPSSNGNDAGWIQWRAKKLNQFLKRLRTEVKAIKPNIDFSMSPSVYPFSLNEYLQDWPTWVDSGWVDKVMPQVYRYDINAYTATLNAVKNNLKGITANCYPGVLLKSGNYTASDAFLNQMVQLNRTLGFAGEVFFFYEGLPERQNWFTVSYPSIK